VDDCNACPHYPEGARPQYPWLCIARVGGRHFRVYRDRQSWTRDEAERHQFKPYLACGSFVSPDLPEGVAAQLRRPAAP
jgi:hypothetical protein